MLKNLSSILSTCVLGDFEDMSAGFDVDIKQSETEWVATLTPKQSKVAAKISSIIISFDKSDMSLNLLKMVEKSGDYTAYTFTNKHETRK
jgi:outer membrane lipoprotein-sorting protein